MDNKKRYRSFGSLISGRDPSGRSMAYKYTDDYEDLLTFAMNPGGIKTV